MSVNDHANDTTGTPADESKPAPGFYVVHPNDHPEAEWTGVVDNNGDFHGEEDGFPRTAASGHYTVSTRLIVINPAQDVDHLAAIVREVDGDHSLGAGALAENIMARLDSRTTARG